MKILVNILKIIRSQSPYLRLFPFIPAYSPLYAFVGGQAGTKFWKIFVLDLKGSKENEEEIFFVFLQVFIEKIKIVFALRNNEDLSFFQK